jgi:hypothetical protein
MRLGALALIFAFASGCSVAQSLQMRNATPRERETVYAVVGTFVVMATVAALIAGPPPEQPAMPRPQDLPPLGR